MSSRLAQAASLAATSAIDTSNDDSGMMGAMGQDESSWMMASNAKPYGLQFQDRARRGPAASPMRGGAGAEQPPVGYDGITGADAEDDTPTLQLGQLSDSDSDYGRGGNGSVDDKEDMQRTLRRPI